MTSVSEKFHANQFVSIISMNFSARPILGIVLIFDARYLNISEEYHANHFVKIMSMIFSYTVGNKFSNFLKGVISSLMGQKAEVFEYMQLL